VDFREKKFEVGPLVIKTIGANSLKLTTGLLLWAAMWSVNATIYLGDWLNEMGEVNIRNTFQVVNRGDVFAVSAMSSLCETKQAITLPPRWR
jgi:hypothetical protein